MKHFLPERAGRKWRGESTAFTYHPDHSDRLPNDSKPQSFEAYKADLDRMATYTKAITRTEMIYEGIKPYIEPKRPIYRSSAFLIIGYYYTVAEQLYYDIVRVADQAVLHLSYVSPQTRGYVARTLSGVHNMDEKVVWLLESEGNIEQLLLKIPYVLSTITKMYAPIPVYIIADHEVFTEQELISQQS